MHSRARAALPLALLAVMALLGTAMTGGAATTPPTVNVADASGSNVMDPSSLSVKTGEPVKFHWNEGGHNAHFTGTPEGDFDLGYQKAGYETTRSFSKPGTYTFVCDSHSKMKGTINVTGAAVQPQPQPDPAPPAADPQPATDPQPTTDPQPAADQPSSSTQISEAQTSSTADAQSAVATSGGSAAATAAPSYAGPPTARFRVVKGTLTVEASEPVRLFLRAVRLGVRGHRVYKRTLDLHRGANKVYLRDWLWGKRYRLELTAVDTDRNAIKPVRMRIAIR